MMRPVGRYIGRRLTYNKNSGRFTMSLIRMYTAHTYMAVGESIGRVGRDNILTNVGFER